MDSQLDRAQGCLFGQLIGDSLGSLVEFQSPERITSAYPEGVTEMKDGGTWNTIAGQPTDDSEMALALARTIVANSGYDQDAARSAYVDWLESEPFDIGNTTHCGLRGVPDFESQANGALMRVSPLGIYATGLDQDLAARQAREDAWITHPHEVAQDANVVFVLTIAETIKHGHERSTAYSAAVRILDDHGLAEPVRTAVMSAERQLPESFMTQQGWVLIALQNAFYQLLHADSFEAALVSTVAHGGDTDTNAAICGALLGAVYGRVGIPFRWIEVIESCIPEAGRQGVQRPRPQQYWPNDAADIAEMLLRIETGRRD